jgi:hypothetical protein
MAFISALFYNNNVSLQLKKILGGRNPRLHQNDKQENMPPNKTSFNLQREKLNGRTQG